jgi:TolB-like protein/AraC-like DNA-binding protein
MATPIGSTGSFLQSPGDKALIAQLEAHIQDNLKNEQFGVEQLAEKVGLNRSHLHRRLKKCTGKSISKFIREYRLKKAFEILQKEDFTISEIAYEVGFGSATYFNKCFAEYFGYPPGQAKRKALTGENSSLILKGSKKKSENKKRRMPKSYILLGAISILIAVAGIYFYQKSKNNTAINTVKIDKSIAVLPFKNLSDSQENQYFADGVMDDILNRLSSIKELRVISRTTMDRYRDAKKTTPEIARELDVSYTLEASVQKYSDTVRIIVQLIAAHTDEHLWVKDFKGEFKDIFALQSTISKQIAAELKTTLSSSEIQQIEKKPTNSIEAYNLYLKGRYFWNRRTEEDLSTSIKYFERSIAIDSKYALAYVGLADAYYGLTRQNFIPDSLGTSKTKELLLKSIDLDNDIAEARATLGMVKCWSDWDWKGAEEEFKRAIELNPNYAIAHHYYSDYLLHIKGLYDQSREHANKALLLNPLSYETTFLSAWHFFIEGRLEEALIESEKAFELNKNIEVNWLNFYIYVKLKRNQEAFNQMEEIMKTMEDKDAESLRANYKKYGIKGVHLWWNKHEIENNIADPFVLAERFAFLGEKEKALTALEASYESHSQFIPLIKHNAFFDNLQSEPRFKTILKQMKLVN